MSPDILTKTASKKKGVPFHPFFSNLTTLLPVSNLVGRRYEAFYGQENHPATESWGKHPGSGKNAA